jgi:hypothetical protein
MRSSVAHNRLSAFLFLLIILISPLVKAQAAGDATIPVGFSTFDAGKGAPYGWVLDRRVGKAVLRLEKDGDVVFVDMISDQSSFGIKKTVKVNIKEYPFLNWTWKANRLPPGGDVRKSETDDQAAQIYIAFPDTGFPSKLNTPVIGYVWDNEAPIEWTGRSQQIGGGKLRYVVVRNKTDKLGEWRTEKRDIYNDYRKLFKDLQGGEPTGPTQGISLYINSQHTKSFAECSIGNIFFSRQ